MRSRIITIFSITVGLVTLIVANPIQNRKASGIAIPLARHTSFLDSNESIDLDIIGSNGLMVREKILRGLDNYEMNTGKMHPFAVNHSESGIGKRGASVPLTTYRYGIWMGEISIGTPPKTLKVQIDTGAAEMWVLQTGCAGISSSRDLWDPHSSESAKYQGKSFHLKYNDGSIIEGYEYYDNVTIAGFTADPQNFGAATSYTSPLKENGYADGLLGLAFPSISQFSNYPLFVSLSRQGKMINPTFSLKLSSSGAEMYVGGSNSILYNGVISYTPVVIPALWQVSMDDIRVGDDKILVNVPVILDTGATYIFGDSGGVSLLYEHLGGTLVEYETFSYYYLPCDSFPTLSFTFGGTPFHIPPEVLRLQPIAEGSPKCYSAIVAQHFPAAYWIIGVTFLQGVYTVFDYTTAQVGFANLA